MAARNAWSGLVLVDNVSGKPISNGKINFWANGTTNDQDTFPTVALSGANVNPLILDANGRVPEAWSNDTDVYAVRVLDENDNVILATVQSMSFIAPFTLSSADVLAALAANAAAVDIAGSSMVGSAFSAFADDLTLTAAGTIDTSAGATVLGTITGDVTATGDLFLTASGAKIDLFAGDVVLTHSAAASGTLTMSSGTTLNVPILEATSEVRSTGPVTVGDGTAAATGQVRVNSDALDGILLLTGALSVSDGGSLRLYGGAHATKADDFEFTGGSGSTVIFGWDASASELTLTNGAFVLSSTAPQNIFIESGVAADNGRWDMVIDAEILQHRVSNDADSFAAAYMTVNRTGTTIDNVNFPLGDFVVSGDEVFLNLPTSAGTTGSLWANAGVVNVA